MELNESRFLERSPFWTDLLLVLRKRAAIILLVFLGTSVGAYVALQFMTEKYESDTSLLVKLGRENAGVPATVVGGAFISTGVRREELNSEVQMFRSRSNVEKVVDSLGPDTFRFDPPPPESWVQAVKYYVKKSYRWVRSQGHAFLVWINLREKLTDRENAILVVDESLSVRAEKDSDVLSASLRLPGRDLAREVLERLVQNYVDAHVEIRRNKNVREFFHEQVAKLELELESMDADQERVLKEWNLADAEQQRSLLLQRLSQAQSKTDANESRRAMLIEELASMDARLEALPEDFRRSETLIRNPSRETIEGRLTELRLERQQLLNRYRPDSDPVKSVEEQIAGLQVLISKEETTRFDSVTTEPHPVRRDFIRKREELIVDLAGLDAESVELGVRVKDLLLRLAELSLGENQLDEILRRRKVVEQTYQVYAERKEDARISDELDELRVANVAVVTPPTTPIKPVYPRKLLIMAVSLPVGLILGLGLALLLEYFNERIDSQRDLESVGGAVYLGTFDLTSPPLSPSAAPGE